MENITEHLKTIITGFAKYTHINFTIIKRHNFVQVKIIS